MSPHLFHWRKWAMGVVVLALMLWPTHPPKAGWLPLWWDWAHVPLFAWFAWEASRLCHQRGYGLWKSAAWIIPSALLAAASVELLQHLTGRFPDWQDVARGMMGALIGWSLAQAKSVQGLSKAALLLLGILALAAGSMPLIQRAYVVNEKRSSFPLLEDFAHDSSLILWSLEMDGEAQTLQTNSSGTGSSLEVVIAPHRNTSLHHDAQGRDWSAYRTLRMQYELAGATSLHLGLRLDASSDPAARSYSEAHLIEGAHVAEFPLPPDARGQEVLKALRGMVLFTTGSETGCVLKVGELRLE